MHCGIIACALNFLAVYVTIITVVYVLTDTEFRMN